MNVVLGALANRSFSYLFVWYTEKSRITAMLSRLAGRLTKEGDV